MIYLDYNATTPVAPEVAAAMQPFLGPEFGNPNCDYPLGIRARDAMHQARREVAALLNCAPDEVLFTAEPLKPTTWSSRAWPSAAARAASSPRPPSTRRSWPPAGGWPPKALR